MSAYTGPLPSNPLAGAADGAAQTAWLCSTVPPAMSSVS